MNNITPLKSIRLHCLECQGTSQKVTKCENVECHFYQYRFGKNPQRKGIGRKGGNPKINVNIRDYK